MEKQRHYLLPLSQFVKKLNGNLFLLFLLTFINASATNISLNYDWATWRNHSQLIRAFEKCIGIDSLSRLVEHSPVVFIKFDCDSLGYIKNLNRLSFVIKDSINDHNRQRIGIVGSSLKHFEKAMIENGIQITRCPEIYLNQNCSPDSIESKLANQIGRISMNYEKNVQEYSIIFRLFAKWKLLKGNYLTSREWITKLCADISTIRTVYLSAIKDSIDANTYDKNDALLLLSMIYTFGDYNVNKWLDNYSFDLNLSLDDNGLVTQIYCNAEDKIPSGLDLQQLLNFLKYNSVRFNSGHPNGQIISSFPSPLYDKNIRSKDFLDRMEILEAKVWYILNQINTSHSTPSN